MNYDLSVHIDMGDPDILGLSIRNIIHYIAALPGETMRVRLVANGPAVQLFTKTCLYADDIADLASKGVTFAMCTNAMKKFEVSSDDLLPACEIVPAGVVELVRLQREGFAYIKP